MSTAQQDTEITLGTGRTTVLQGIVPGEPIQVILSGQYIDCFEKVQSRWRFSDRLFVAGLIGDQRNHFR